MKLKDIILGEISQTVKNIYYMNPLMLTIERKETGNEMG